MNYINFSAKSDSLHWREVWDNTNNSLGNQIWRQIKSPVHGVVWRVQIMAEAQIVDEISQK